MVGYLLTQKARCDLLEIWSYIARDSEIYADDFIGNFTERFSILGQNPRAGRQCNEILPGIRSFPMGEYLILYRIDKPGVQILRVVHGRRNLTQLRL